MVAGTITLEYLSTVFTAGLPVLSNTHQLFDAPSKSEQILDLFVCNMQASKECLGLASLFYT
jgi:hypothetical protein